MANEVLRKLGTPVVFADTTDYSASGSGYSRTAQIDLTSLADTKARQSDKVDLGATRAPMYAVYAGIEFNVAPTAGEVVDVYWSGSASGTAGTGNDGGASGSDGAYKDSEESEWVNQLEWIGRLVATNDAATTVQRQKIGVFDPGQRYGQIVVHNRSGQELEGDAVEMYVALVPLIDEVQ